MILEGRMLLDPVRMLIAIPPKYAVSQVVGYMKGKSAIHMARTYLRMKTATTLHQCRRNGRFHQDIEGDNGKSA